MFALAPGVRGGAPQQADSARGGGTPSGTMEPSGDLLAIGGASISKVASPAFEDPFASQPDSGAGACCGVGSVSTASDIN